MFILQRISLVASAVTHPLTGIRENAAPTPDTHTSDQAASSHALSKGIWDVSEVFYDVEPEKLTTPPQGETEQRTHVVLRTDPAFALALYSPATAV